MKTIAHQLATALPVLPRPPFEKAPELDILSLLDAAALVAIRAATCAHPVLASQSGNSQPSDPAPLYLRANECTALAILSHLEALRFAISSYHRCRTKELALASDCSSPSTSL